MTQVRTNINLLALAFRLTAFGLAAGYWLYYVGSRPFDATGGWRYLTNWGLTLNLVIGTWALGGMFIPVLQRPNPLLPTALTVSSAVVILYWSLYLISPTLVNGSGGLTWYSEFYLHLGTTIMVYIEALWLNQPPQKTFRALAPVALVGTTYLAWVDLVVSKVNASPCGLRTDVCGYPYPFLNDFTPLPRGLFYVTTCAGGVLLGGIILKLWRKLSSTEHT